MSSKIPSVVAGTKRTSDEAELGPPSLDEKKSKIAKSSTSTNLRTTRSTRTLTQPKSFNLGGGKPPSADERNITKRSFSASSSTSGKSAASGVRPPTATGTRGPTRVPSTAKPPSVTVPSTARPRVISTIARPAPDAFEQIQNRLLSIEEARQRDHDEMKLLMEKEQGRRREVEVESTKIQMEGRRDVELFLVSECAARCSSLETKLSERDSALIEARTQLTALTAQVASVEEKLVAERERLQNQKVLELMELRREEERRELLKNDEVEKIRKKLSEMEKAMRKLRNEVMDAKGCLRVVCRVRPLLPHESLPATFVYPDEGTSSREIGLRIRPDEDSNGRGGEWNFQFDRVFVPDSDATRESKQREVFEELEALTTSVIDGWNCCVFAYGVTGSGKSYTMEGPGGDERGLIPRAVEHLFESIEELKERGWTYSIEGQFVEIYNETIHDLLLPAGENWDDKKLEIKHDPKTGQTRVTDCTLVPLTSSSQVHQLLTHASTRRTTASTLLNARSSRSHSVFTLRISGTSSRMGESTNATLNLVDLAGSERVNVSGTGDNKERLKETQSINKSLSALGDVIAALGERDKTKGGEGGHVPYRNSKLTWLLSGALGGNCKTLMVLNLSPLAMHAQESLTSLRFATKVNSTSTGVVVRGVSGGGAVGKK
ncbi:P-loop containing nucleoside triphosphate hydrolase protein [Flagelloscypha sp. PMI_526]|nr:P-loop containing nucleoside triphosphate hydrolase protein [Flagelloscypha sp. PMI_526]